MANAKGTKKMNEVIEAEVKDVDFGDLELKIAKPTLNTDKTISIGGNFTELGNKIKSVVERYKNTKLTEDNVDYVKTLKNQFVSLRTGIEREKKEYMKVYIAPAKDLVDSMCKELLKIVDEGESALGNQLEEYDQRRKEELTIILNDYVAEYSKKYHLRDEYATQIQLIKQYYNKTQKEEDTILDIERQAKELYVKQNEYDNGVALIKAECEEGGLLPDAYIRELSYRNAMEIIMEIKQDKKAKAEMLKKVDEGQKVTIGLDDSSDLAQQLAKAREFEDKEEELRVRVLRIKYKGNQAKALAQCFKSLGIEYEFIKTDF